MEALKTCASCKKGASYVPFNRDRTRKGGLSAYCCECLRKRRKARYAADPEAAKTATKEWREKNIDQRSAYNRSYRTNNPNTIRDQKLRSMYGLSLNEWEQMFEDQSRRCAICKTDDAGRKGWQTDHDHETTKVRGILCMRCNTALGSMKDSVEIAESAVEYLRHHGK